MTWTDRRREYEARMRAAWEPEGTCAGIWVVQRHGGASTHRWRTSWWGPYQDAERAGTIQASEMRQGAVRLVAPDGTIVWTCTAPRLRRRW